MYRLSLAGNSFEPEITMRSRSLSESASNQRELTSSLVFELAKFAEVSAMSLPLSFRNNRPGSFADPPRNRSESLSPSKSLQDIAGPRADCLFGSRGCILKSSNVDSL